MLMSPLLVNFGLQVDQVGGIMHLLIFKCSWFKRVTHIWNRNIKFVCRRNFQFIQHLAIDIRKKSGTYKAQEVFFVSDSNSITAKYHKKTEAN